MPKTFTTDDGYDPTELMLYAKDHLSCAKFIFEMGAPLWLDSAGYLSQLTIELALKAHLLDRVGKFPASHNLMYLAERADEEGVSLSDLCVDILMRVNSFGTLRYPDPQDQIEVGTEDWDDIQQLFDELVAHKPELADDRHRKTPEGWIRKGGRVLMKKPRDAEE